MNKSNPGAGNGFGLARFGQEGESIRGVEVKVGDPQFTLLWDTEVDLDLHVIEPGGKEIYQEDSKGARSGEFNVDNTKGYSAASPSRPTGKSWIKHDGKVTVVNGKFRVLNERNDRDALRIRVRKYTKASAIRQVRRRPRINPGSFLTLERSDEGALADQQNLGKLPIL